MPGLFDRPAGKSSGGILGFGRKDEPQSKFFEMFGDKYSMRDKNNAPVSETVAPDVSPSTPVTPKKPKAKKKAVSPAGSPDGLLRRGSRKSFSKTDGPPVLTVEDLSGAYTEPVRRKSSFSRPQASAANGTHVEVGFNQMVNAHVDSPSIKRKSSLARMVSRDKDGDLQRFASASSDNADGSYRRSSVIRAFASKPESPDAGVQRSESRRRSFAPLGSNVGEFDFNQLRRKTSRDEGLSRSKSNVESNEPRVITFDEMAAEPKLERKSSVSAPVEGRRRLSFAPLGAMAGGMEFNLQRRSSRDDTLTRTKSQEARVLGFDDLAAEPQLRRKQSIKFAQADAPRRKSFAPLGNAVGEIDFNQLRRRSSTEEPALARAKSNVEPRTIGLDEMSKDPPLQRKSSIKFAGEERRRSFALLGSNAGGFEFDQLSRSKSRDSARRQSLVRTTSKGEPITIGFDDLANQPYVEPTAGATISRSNSTRRRSFAPLGSAAGEIDLSLVQTRSRTDGPNLDRRLSLSRTRSKEPPKEIGFDDLVNQPFTKASAIVSGDKERRRSIAPLGSSVQPIDFGQLERQTSRGGGLGRRLSLGRSTSRKAASEEKDVPPPVIIPARPQASTDDASDREAYATPPEPEEGEDRAVGADVAPDADGSNASDKDEAEADAEVERDNAETGLAPPVGDRTPSPMAHHGVLNGILLRPESRAAETTDQDQPEPAQPREHSLTEGLDKSAMVAAVPNGPERSTEVINKGYLTYQTPHAREWRRRWYRIIGHELELYIAKEDLAPTQKIKLGPHSTIDLEYEGSQAEGSFRIRAVTDDGQDDYFVFCDSSALKTKLIESLRAAVV